MSLLTSSTITQQLPKWCSDMRLDHTLSKARSRGLTLVELMVGITVAMIGLLVITAVLENSSRHKRTTASGADAQTSGAIASHMVETDVRMAGYAISNPSLLGCEIYGYDEGTSPARNFVFSFVPVTISAGVANDYGVPDNLTITYGTSDVGFSAPTLVQAHNGNNANYKVSSRFGFHEGDLVVVAEQADNFTPDATTFAPLAGANGISDCVLAQVTGVPGTPGQTDNIIHNSGNYTNALGQNVPARYNKPGGLGVSFSTAAQVFNIGPLPVNVTYAVSTSHQLTRINAVVDVAARSIGENIVMLRAQYGKDTNSDGVVDTWDKTTPTTPALWQQVVALHFAVVARSHARESTMVTGASLQLWPDVTLPGGGTAAGQTLALSDEQRRYRYKVFHSLVPLRNMIWSNS